jgi:DNA processing protein
VAAALAAEELGAWLRLVYGAGVGRETARRLLAAFGSPQAVFAAPTAARRGVIGVAAAAALEAAPEGHAERWRATLAWRDAAPARRVMVLGDADYPQWLLQTADPPLLLFLAGRTELLAAPSLAIVGSRRPTPQGAANARAFAAALSERSWTIVSGLAAGIDAAAHEGALTAAGGTIAVVGTGLDIVYPRAHRDLAAHIVRQGLMVSELPLGTPPLAAHFPQRNRIIAGLTRGTLVVEAAPQSGSLITARLAAEAGREVFAIPGSIHSPQSRGCHALIRQGAKLVETAQDMLEELSPAAAPTAAAAEPPLDDADADDSVLRALGHDPASLDALIARCGWPAPALSAHLLTLELQGRVVRLPGGLYQRITVS